MAESLAGKPRVLSTAEAVELRAVDSDAEAEGLARRLRARWVVEALDDLAQQAGEHVAWLRSRAQDQSDHARVVGAREVWEMTRRHAAEYQGGAR